jgi:hypothetical protein
MPLEESPAFRRFVEVFVDEAGIHGWAVPASGAAKLLAEHINRVADSTGPGRAGAPGMHLDEDQVRALARAYIPVAAACGATGREDEPAIPVPQELLGHLVANLGQAARFSASHHRNLPHAGLHNVVADALVIVGAAVAASGAGPALVPGYGLRLARRALDLVAGGIRSGWVLELDEPEGITLADLTEEVVNVMEWVVAELNSILPELPPPTAIREGGPTPPAPRSAGRR